MDEKEEKRIYTEIEKANIIQSQLDILERKSHQKTLVKLFILFACVTILIVWAIVTFSPKTVTGFYVTVTLNFSFLLIVIAILGLDTFADSVKERENAVNTLRIDVLKDKVLSLQKECSELKQKYDESLKEKT